MTRITKRPAPDKKRKWISVSLTVFIAGLLTIWGIYGIGEYGIALFILTPLFIGAGSTIFYGYKKRITKRDAFEIGSLTLCIFAAVLFVCAMEGLICIVMAAPFGILFTWIGCLIGFALINNAPAQSHRAMFFLIGIIPSVSFMEKGSQPTVVSATTSIEIDASLQTVWKNVIEFPELGEPTELIFKMGIAYPTSAKIDGNGVGAIRHCNFSTGSFVEPIVVWDEPRLLKFDVIEQPAPMKEVSFWNINAPHLHDYFVSKQGQFKLTQLPNGKTLLEGTTWYYHNIKPEFYWRLWSNFIIHKIHNRVLTHIKVNAERQEKKPAQ